MVLHATATNKQSPSTQEFQLVSGLAPENGFPQFVPKLPACGAFKSHIELTTDFSQIHRGQLTSCLPSHRKEISHTVSGHLVAVLLTEISTCAAASATRPQPGRRIAGLTATSILLRTSARQKPWLGRVGKKASTFDAFFATSKAFSPRACPLSASGGLGWLWSVQFFVVSLLAFSASNWPLGLE